jgi:hypothetical protein
MKKNHLVFAGIFFALSFGFLHAQVPVDTQSTQTQVNPNLEQSATATQTWLSLIDTGNYGQAWDSSSKLFQQTINKPQWQQLMDSSRKPLGSIRNRTVLDQRTASNPRGLPAGDYMVMFYNTAFANKPSAYELVTLMKEPDGKWRILTYQVQ